MSLVIRKATAADQAAIGALIESERLNPYGNHWPNFWVAGEGNQLIGAVQVRRHKDGSGELGSLVVVPARRGQGMAARLIEHVLAAEPGPMHMITGRAFATHYARWGFEPIGLRRAPASVRRHYVLGQLIGSAHALVTRRPINRLVILAREF